MSNSQPLHGTLSPSLCGASPDEARRLAYEVKFLVDEPTAQRVEAWARALLHPDPHGQPELNGAYRTTSLYFDTRELDVYHRSPGYRRGKYRARRYGLTTWVYVERKRKAGDCVVKRRAAIAAVDLTRLAEPTASPIAAPGAPPDAWAGAWFHQRLLEKRLRPACRVTYVRTAYIGQGVDGPMRLTMDREVRGVITDRWGLEPADDGRLVLEGRVILELKFLNAMPIRFRELMVSERLTPAGFSKYRAMRDAWSESGAGVGGAHVEVRRA